MRFVELSIEKFIRHAKKVKVDSPHRPKFRERLTDAEAALLERYYLPKEAIKPSLVAFPYFQAFPSRVHRVMHSSRTGCLIDAMQLLQGLSSSDSGGNFGHDVCLEMVFLLFTCIFISVIYVLVFIISSQLSRSVQCLITGSVDKRTESGKGNTLYC